MGPRGSAHRSAVPGRYNSGVDLRAAASLPAAYLLGSIPFAFLAVKWRRGVDIRTLGSGNVGATNAGRILGKPAAVAIYALDAGKGAASVLLARWLSAEADPLLEVGAGLLAIIGHVFPIWLGFRGGKGVATTTGVFAALMPIAFLIAGGAWIVVAAVTRYVSLASIALALAFPLAMAAVDREEAFRERLPVTILGIVAALFILVRHMPNIRRVLARTEPKIGARREPPPPPPAAPAPSPGSQGKP